MSCESDLRIQRHGICAHRLASTSSKEKTKRRFTLYASRVFNTGTSSQKGKEVKQGKTKSLDKMYSTLSDFLMHQKRKEVLISGRTVLPQTIQLKKDGDFRGDGCYTIYTSFNDYKVCHHHPTRPKSTNRNKQGLAFYMKTSHDTSL